MNTVSLLLVVLFAVAASAEEEVARKPKLFFVSTSATTTTLQTLSICHVSSNVISTCGKRRRRSINIDGLTPEDAAPVDLEPSQREQAMSAPALHGSREGRFLLYWITTTSISTSFTTTYSISSALCTSPGANLCG